MIVHLIAPLLTLAVLLLTLASCVSDMRTMRIPNWHSAAVIVAFILSFAASPDSFGKWWDPLASFALMFAATFFMYWKNMIGSGDTKLGSVLALWVGLKGLVIYLFYMTLLGGILGGLSLVLLRRKPFAHPLPGSWMAQAQDGKRVVPYGVAISFGAWGALLHTGFISHQLHELFKIIH